MNKITNIPFHELCASDEFDATCDDFLERFKLRNTPWFLPQTLAHIGTYKLPSTNEKINAKEFLALNCPDQWNKGLWIFLQNTTRSKLCFTKRSYDKEFLPYNSLVPLYMAGMKKFQNITYSRWDKVDSHFVLGDELFKACSFEYSGPELTVDRILELRAISLNGKNPETTYALNGLRNTELDKAPALWKVMLMQTWCAHPVHRNEYMILDPVNWDNVPAPLIPTVRTSKNWWD